MMMGLTERILKPAALLLAVCVAAAAPGAQQPPAAPATGLKIVVIAGEDAVNIIQQKTAVRPVVEVRDRNDLPVSGASVTFAILGKNASFGGAQTLTVITNAAGRAAVTTLTPVASGAVQISATATVAGQTATVTITQTNFLTAAAAAQAGAGGAGAGGATGAGAAAGTGAAAASGGLSGAAIAGIAVGGAVAAAVGVKAATGGGDSSGGSNGGSTPCTFNVAPTSLTAQHLGGTVFVEVTQNAGTCQNANWTATSNASFLTFGSGSNSVTRTGPQRLDALVAVNEGGNPQRTGTFTVAGQTVTVTQTARCLLSATPPNLAFPQTGGTQTITVTVTPSVCEDPSWRVNAGPQTFVVFNPPNGSGSGSTAVTIPAQSSHGAVGGAISVSGQMTNVLIQWTQPIQKAAAQCSAQRVQGGDVPVTRTIDVGRTSGRPQFRFDNGAESPDRMVVSYEGRTLFDTGCVATAGPRTEYLSFSGRSTKLNVQVIPNCRGGSGSTWTFEMACSQ